MNIAMKYPCFLTLIAAALGGCAQPTGVSLRQNGSDPVALAGDSALLPQSGICFELSPLDRIRVQILPLPLASGGALFAPYDRVQYDFTLQGAEYRVLRGDYLTVHFGADPKLERSGETHKNWGGNEKKH